MWYQAAELRARKTFSFAPAAGRQAVWKRKQLTMNELCVRRRVGWLKHNWQWVDRSREVQTGLRDGTKEYITSKEHFPPESAVESRFVMSAGVWESH